MRSTPEFAEFRNEVGRRRAVIKRPVEAMRDQLGLKNDRLVQAHGFLFPRAEATTALEEAGKRSPNNPEVLHARAAVERRRGNYEKSNQLMERSLKRDPFVHLGKLRRAPEWDGLRANAFFQGPVSINPIPRT